MESDLKRLSNSALNQFVLELENRVTSNRASKVKDVLAQRTRFISVILEDLYDSQNASAVIRSCDSFGIQDIYVAENRNKFDVKRKVSAGSFKWIDIHRFNEAQENNTQKIFNILRKKNYRIAVSSPHKKSNSLESWFPNQPTAFVLGSESEGVSDFALENCDETIHIPMVGFAESLNISVSAALILYTLTQKIRSSKLPWQLSLREATELKAKWYMKVVRKSELMLKKF